MHDLPTIQLAIQHGIDRLGPTSASARLDTEVLLAAALKRPRSYLITHPGENLPGAAAEQFLAWVDQRTVGVPLAYLIGRKEFWSLDLAITPAVLVPRPETELLVETALALVAKARAISILDLGTGSGAIALAVAQELPQASIVATDIDEAALELARANAARLGLRNLSFLEGDWYEPLGVRRFELILSNPPYISADDPALQTPELRAEPRHALTPGASGLEAIERIAFGARNHLNTGGWLALEHGATQAQAIGQLFSRHRLSDITHKRDLAGHDRVTYGRLV